MPSKSELNNRVVREISANEAEIDAFVLRLEKFLNKNLRKILKSVLIGDIKGIQAATIIGGIEQALINSGLQTQLAGLEKIYGNRLRDVRSQLQVSVPNQEVLTGADFQLAETLITFDTSKVANRITGYVDDVAGTLMRGVIIGEVPDFSLLEDTLGSGLVNNLTTELNTLTQGFYRTITQKKADELGLNLRLYQGPDDKVTRPFCKEHVGNIYTVEQIKNMDNNQGLDVLTYGGGYNCRHEWSPVSETLAKQLGYSP